MEHELTLAMYRDRLDEIATLRQELAEAKAELGRSERVLVEVRSVLDQTLRVGDRSETVAAWMQRDYAIEQRDALCAAATRVVQLAGRDQTIATHEAIGELRQALREGGGQ